MTILITGATGTIGRQLTRELLARGQAVRAASRRLEALDDLKNAGAEIARVDLEDATTLEKAFDGVERLFLLGPQGPDFGDRLEAVVAAAVEAGVKHIVRYSALGADANAGFRLARQHGIAEKHVENSGVAWTILQPTFYQDNLVNFAGDSSRSQGAFYGASGDGKTAFISSADIARVAAAVLLDPDKHAGKRYVLTGPEAIGATDLAALASEVIGREVKYVDLRGEALAAAMTEAGTPEFMVEAMVALEGIKKAGYAADVSSSVADILGQEPESYRAYLERNRGKLA